MLILALVSKLAACATDKRTIAEAWGENAVPKSCFTIEPDVGSIQRGQ